MPEASGSDATARTALQLAIERSRRGFAAAGVFSLVLNMLMLASPLYMLQVYQRVLTSGETSTLLFLTVIALFAIAILGALEALRSWILNRVANWLGSSLSPALIQSSVSVSLAGGGRGAQALRDLGQIQGFVGGQGITALMDSPWVPVFVAIIWLMHPTLGMLALGAAVVLFGLALLNEHLTRKPLMEGNRAQMGAHNFVDTSLRNAEIVHAMGMMPALIGRWRERDDEARASQMLASDRGGAITGFTKFFRLAVQVGILGAGAMLVIAGELNPGQMIAASILLSRALAPVEQSIGAWRNFTGARGAYGRLQELLRAVPPETPGFELPEPRGAVAAEKATFYPQGADKPIVQNVSFELQPGEALGVIGPSASGKSTLCRLLVGVWRPQAGAIRLDGAEMHAWDRVDFGRYVGYLPQDVELFEGTIRENIARMGEADDADVVAAAQLAGVHDMILHMPEGYHTPVGIGGASLSGGQRQRIGLARALFGQPKLLVLDEPDSSLDQPGQEALTSALHHMKSVGTTIVLVRHNLSSVEVMDKLLVMAEGKVDLFGPTQAVLHKLRERQAGGAQRSIQGKEPPKVTEFTLRRKGDDG